MYCRNCGKEYSGNFCPECGTPANAEICEIKKAADEQKQIELIEKGTAAGIGRGCLSVIGVVIGMALFFHGLLGFMNS